MALLATSSFYRAPPYAAAASAPSGRVILRLAAAGSASALRDAALPPRPATVDRRRCECFDLHRQVVPFGDALAWQDSIVARRKRLADTGEDRSDTLIALQHPPVYTLGTATKKEDLHFNPEDAPFELHHVNRAGKATYHGPGQLVVYPILNLWHHNTDHHRYLRSLEEVIIRALKSAFSIKASRVEDLTGVWVGDRKVASIGIHVALGKIAFHGVALNVTTDLAPFGMIVPCGIKDRGIGSVKELLQKASDGREMDDKLLMDITYNSLIEEFAEIFKLSLVSPDISFQ